MNLQSFCTRAGLAVAGAGVVGYAALATLLPAAAPARPPAAVVQVAQVAPSPAAVPASPVEAPAKLPVAIPPATPVIASPAVPVRTEPPPRAGFAARVPASASVQPSSRPAHRAVEPRSTKRPHGLATNAGGRANAERARALGRAIRAEAAPATPVSYKVPGGSRRWSYRRVY